MVCADHYQALYHGLSHTASAFNPSVQEMFWRSDYERWREFPVTNRQAKVFVDLRSRGTCDEPMRNIVSQLYALSDSNGSMALYEKKP